MWNKACLTVAIIAIAGLALADKPHVRTIDPDAVSRGPATNWTPVERQDYTCYPQASSRWTGSTDGLSITQTSLVCGYNTDDGWMAFDVSGIPDGETINNVTFNFYVNATYYPYWSTTPVSVDPLTADPATLYSDINAEATSGYYNYQNESSSYATGWHSLILSGNANADLAAALPGDMFTVGIVSRDNNTTYYIVMDGWAEDNPPYIEVNRSLPFCGPYDYGSWIGDMAYNPNTGTLYQVEVGSPNGIFEWDPSGCALINYCTGVPWGISQRGIGYDPVENVCYVGGWGNAMGEIFVFHPPPSCALVRTLYIDVAYYAVAGIAYDPDCGIVWCITNSNPDYLLGVDPFSGATVAGPYTVGWLGGTDGYDGAGLAWIPENGDVDSHGELVATNQYANAMEILDRSNGASVAFQGFADNTFGWGLGHVWGSGEVWSSEIYTFRNWYEDLPAYTPLVYTCSVGAEEGETRPVTGQIGPLNVVPNPFTGSTDISFSVAGRIEADMTVYDPSGRSVRTLHNGVLETGKVTLTWDGRDNIGRRLPEGVYFVKLKTESFNAAKKVILK
jgi:hypothetical protein